MSSLSEYHMTKCDKVVSICRQKWPFPMQSFVWALIWRSETNLTTLSTHNSIRDRRKDYNSMKQNFNKAILSSLRQLKERDFIWKQILPGNRFHRHFGATEKKFAPFTLYFKCTYPCRTVNRYLLGWSKNITFLNRRSELLIFITFGHFFGDLLIISAYFPSDPLINSESNCFRNFLVRILKIFTLKGIKFSFQEIFSSFWEIPTLLFLFRVSSCLQKWWKDVVFLQSIT